MTAAAKEGSTAPAARGLPLPVLAGLFVALAGSAGYLVVPMVVAALRHSAVPETWIGLIGSADPVGMFLGAALALLAPVRLRPRRSALVAMALSLACNAASLAVRDPSALLLLRTATGTMGGIALAVGLSVLATSRFPDRSFALFTLSQMLFGGMVAWLGEAGLGGLDILYVSMFAIQAVGLAAALLLPALAAAASAGAVATRALDWRLVAFTAVANLLAAAGFLMLWANIQAAAGAAGLPPTSAVAVIDAGLAGGFAGAILVLLIDGSRRRGLMTAILFAIGLAAICTIGLTARMPVFLAAVFLFQLSTTAAFFGFGAVSEADPAGRLPIVHILAVKAGFGLAPMAASALVVTRGLDAVLVASFAATLLAMILYQRLIVRAEAGRDEARDPPSTA